MIAALHEAPASQLKPYADDVSMPRRQLAVWRCITCGVPAD
jgi:hypothetical protein